MKKLLPLTVALLALVTLAAGAADTAYTALQVVGKKLGANSLQHVLEVQGRYGTPDPANWKITLADVDGGAGVRELEVQKGKIVADRNPNRPPRGSLLDFNRLNLDSEGVFSLVNQEAQKSKVPFDRVDYSLVDGGRGQAPVWKLSLWDGRNGQVGHFTISADNGNILDGGFDNSSRRNLPPSPPLTDNRRYDNDDRQYLDDEADRRRYDDYERDRDRDRGEYSGTGGGFAGKIERHFERRGRQIKKFFSGGYFH